MSVKSRADLLAEIASLLADNTTGDVSLGDFRTVLTDIADSCSNPTSDIGATGAYAFSGAVQYYANQITVYNGVIYIANTTTTVDGAFHASEWDALSNTIYKTTVTLTAAEVKNLFTVPMTIVSAVTGKSIQVVSSNLKVNYGTVAFATDTSPYLYIDTADKRQADFPTALAATVTRKVTGIPFSYIGALGATNTQLVDNKALKITCAANPTAGDSTVTITVFYLLV